MFIVCSCNRVAHVDVINKRKWRRRWWRRRRRRRRDESLRSLVVMLYDVCVCALQWARPDPDPADPRSTATGRLRHRRRHDADPWGLRTSAAWAAATTTTTLPTTAGAWTVCPFTSLYRPDHLADQPHNPAFYFLPLIYRVAQKLDRRCYWVKKAPNILQGSVATRYRRDGSCSDAFVALTYFGIHMWKSLNISHYSAKLRA